MLFEGWGLHLSSSPLHVEGHPFHARNNVNGVGIDSILDYQVLPLDPHIQALQDAYIRHVIDTVHDLPNVLWEVANESSGGGKVDLEFAGFLGLDTVPEWGDSTEWQYWVIDTVKRLRERDGLRPASDRDDDAVPRPRPVEGERAAVRQPRRMDLTRVRGTGLRAGQPREARAVVRESTAGRWEEGRDHRHRSLRAGRRRCAVGLEVVPPRSTIRS